MLRVVLLKYINYLRNPITWISAGIMIIEAIRSIISDPAELFKTIILGVLTSVCLPLEIAETMLDIVNTGQMADSILKSKEISLDDKILQFAILTAIVAFMIVLEVVTAGIGDGGGGAVRRNIDVDLNAGKPRKHLALGLNYDPQHSDIDIGTPFRERLRKMGIDAKFVNEWEGRDFNFTNEELGDFILHCMREADEIHFSLEKFNFNRFKRYLKHKRFRKFTDRNVTNWELYHILNPANDFWKKVKFYI